VFLQADIHAAVLCTCIYIYTFKHVHENSVSITPLLPLAAASIKPRLQLPSPTRRLQSNLPSVTTPRRCLTYLLSHYRSREWQQASSSCRVSSSYANRSVITINYTLCPEKETKVLFCNIFCKTPAIPMKSGTQLSSE